MPSRLENKAPMFYMYAGDFLSDMNVKLMTMAQRGMFLTLLLHEWIEGSLPTDTRHLKTLCDNHPDFDSDWQAIKHVFFEEDGRLYNKRIEKERSKMLAKRTLNSENGKKGARARWQRHSEAIATPSNKEIEIEVVNNKQVKVKLYSQEFEKDFWVIYPRRDNKKRAKEKYCSLRNGGVEKDVIINGLKAYIKQWRKAGTEAEFIPMASTWLNQERYDDELISGSKVIKNLSPKKTYEWMCIECGREKKTDKELKISEKLCECGEGYYESKIQVMQEIAIERSKEARKDADAKASVTEVGGASTEQAGEVTPAPTLPKDSDEKKEFDKAFGSLVNSLGAQ